jgi:hypothetical protein
LLSSFPLPQISNNTTTQIDDYEKIVKDKREEVKKFIEAAGEVTEEAKELARAVHRESWILADGYNFEPDSGYGE